MRPYQYVYFAIFSKSVSAQELTALVGMQPDRSMVRSSKRTDPPIPTSHSWELVSNLYSLRIDDQIEKLIERMRPVERAIVEVAARNDCKAGLQIVRYFDHPDGQPDDPSTIENEGRTLEKLGGQHRLIGWHLDRSTLDFLSRTGAEIDVDEYEHKLTL